MSIAGFTVGVIGLAVGILALFHWTIDIRRKARWKKVITAIRELEKQIRSRRFDAVIGLADGLVPAAIIVLNWRIPEIYFIDAPLANRMQSSQAARIETKGLPHLEGKRVLLVDTQIYTGTNMRAATQALKELGVTEIVTAALFRHTGTTAVFTPDYYIYEVHGAVRSEPWSITSDHRHEYLSLCPIVKTARHDQPLLRRYRMDGEHQTTFPQRLGSAMSCLIPR